MRKSPEIRVLQGHDVARWLPQVASLRISVFRDFPYLYGGDLDYEAKYLAAYARSSGSVFVLAFDGDTVVGASTGIPLADESEAFQKPFVERGTPVGQVFYCGESVLQDNYRGFGIGHRFFDKREAHARCLGGFRLIAFAAVDRDNDDRRRPAGHRDNDAFWIKRGYVRQPGMSMRLAWREMGEERESEKSLTFWMREL